jgi:hypothetical protein
MGDRRDIILSVFACSSQAPCQAWAKKYFEEEPVVLVVPGGGGQEFRAKLKRWAQSGDVFGAALKELRPGSDIEIGRRGLVTFSAGWSFADELLRFEAERLRLDAYLLLDGCHAQDRGHWAQYASRAANLDGAFMVMAHSSIVPPGMPSATATNTDIFNRACAANDASSSPRVTSDIPEYVAVATLPASGISISLGASPGLSAVSKRWSKDPLQSHDSRGDLTRLGYDGNDRPDHVYVAWHVSERLWRWLGERWRKPAAPEQPADPSLIS